MNEIQIELEIQAEGGGDPVVLKVLRLDGREEIGLPYEFHVEARHSIEQGLLEIDKIVAQRVAIAFRVVGTDQIATTRRTVRGVVTEIQDSLEPQGRFTRVYKLTIRPALAELERFVSQDIFVGDSYPAVVQAKLEGARFAPADYAFRLRDPALYGEGTWGDGASDTLEQGRLVVQYRESDLSFISRLMEHVGVSIVFEDAGDREVMVFADHPGGFPERADAVPFRGNGDDHGVTKLARKLRAIAGDFYVYDYNYRTPTLTFGRGDEQLFDVLGGESHLDVPSAGVLLEYAPNAKTPAEAELLATIRSEEQEGRRERFHGESVESSLYAGLRFKLDGHPEVESSEQLLVVSMVHRFRDVESFEPGAQARGEYHNTFEAVRADKAGSKGRRIPYRPERRTPKPRIFGVVTGVVQSATEEQMLRYQHIDGQGRYLVKLHFDQGPKVMPRMRMAQPHAGTDYGHHFPLRPGVEVLVGFHDGDPDRPVIVGAVPNPIQVSPVTQAKDKEPLDMSRIKTRSGVIIEISDGPVTDH